MKRGSFFSILLILMMLVSVSMGADEITLRLESKVIETWDGQDATYYPDGEPVVWQVRGSKFSAEGLPRMTYVMNEWPIDMFGSYPEDPESLGVLGINGAFVRQGFNQIELIPGTGTGENFVARPLPMPGRVRMLDFWVWGSNYDFYVETHFQDYRGMAYTLKPVRVEQRREPGSIKFVGWKNMFVEMPHYIRQAMNYKPELANVSLSKLVFSTHPEENVSNFYIYVDHLKVLTDMHESYYDGFDLTSPDRVAEVWGSGE
ncbi:MAG: flagellar filament outer layer protein FlaA [Spirochaetales bacterium]|nr:flagellar filament outer layer protein FlaA [Spirochaetales bacterium]